MIIRPMGTHHDLPGKAGRLMTIATYSSAISHSLLTTVYFSPLSSLLLFRWHCLQPCSERNHGGAPPCCRYYLHYRGGVLSKYVRRRNVWFAGITKPLYISKSLTVIREPEPRGVHQLGLLRVPLDVVRVQGHHGFIHGI
jgi:hypothetical protein